MRSKEDIMELSEEVFMETYASKSMQHYNGEKSSTPMAMSSTKAIGRTSRQGSEKIGGDISRNNNSTINKTEPKIKGNMPANAKYDVTKANCDSSDVNKSQDKMKRRLRKISVDKLSSFGGAVQAAMSRRRKSVSSDAPALHQLKIDGRYDEKKIPSWVSPYPSRKHGTFSSVSDDRDLDVGSPTDSLTVPPLNSPSSVPPSPLHNNCIHQGYLDFRNRKKRWEKYWCVLHDECIYCYFTPQSEKRRDVIFLQGYDVVADVKNLNKARFIFHLQQQGVPNVHFSTDNHRDFLLWVGCLEKHMTKDKRSRSIPDETSAEVAGAEEIRKESHKKLSLRKKHRASLPNIRSTPTIRKDFLRQQREGSLKLKLDQEFVVMQKQKLLDELALQKEQLLEEQQLLDALPSCSRMEELKRSPYVRRMSRDQVMEEYEKQKVQEEMRAKNFETILNCRRNSFHIKMSHISKNMSPNLGESKRENLAKLADMGKKLNETQTALAVIDRELKEGNATKQLEEDIGPSNVTDAVAAEMRSKTATRARVKKHNLERLQRKRDLELLIVEQQEAMETMRRRPTNNTGKRQRRRSYDMSMTLPAGLSSSFFSFDDDLPPKSPRTPQEKVFEDYNFTSRPINPPNSLKLLSPNQEKSKFYLGDDDVTTDEDSGFQASNEKLEGENMDHFYHASLKNSTSSSSKQSSEVDGIRISTSSYDLDDSFNKTRASSQTSPRGKEEIDSSILAKIEDFEVFAKLKLQQNSKETKI